MIVRISHSGSCVSVVSCILAATDYRGFPLNTSYKLKKLYGIIQEDDRHAPKNYLGTSRPFFVRTGSDARTSQ